MTSQGTTRMIFRWIHLIFSIPILGYIYSPFDKVHGLRSSHPVCFRSGHSPDGIVDVEGARRSTTLLEEDDIGDGEGNLTSTMVAFGWRSL